MKKASRLSQSKKYFYLSIFVVCITLLNTTTIYAQNRTNNTKPDQTIFAFGGDINDKFVQYVVDLTGKTNPKICYVPTASADNEDNIKYWKYICEKLAIEPHILKVWVSSTHESKTFEETLLDMDAIVVGGGNTLNMLGIWKAQGIDEIMGKALKKGIILAGGSAGSICWFQNGISDSRPVHLSIVDGLAYLPYSNCPHYSDSLKKEIYHQKIKSHEMNSGYASDDLSGILFKNGKFVEAVSKNEINNSYFVTLKNGTIQTEQLKSKILIDKNAISQNSYKAINIDKEVRDFAERNEQDTPLNAFISIKYILANGQSSKLKQLTCNFLQTCMKDDVTDEIISEERRNKILNTYINKILIYNDSLAAVISKISDDFYGIWYFYKEGGKWLSAGEDMGGETIIETEISFREKAAVHLNRIEN
ncbi:peptidase E [Dysgonomonas sp. ZJ709]|uniref:Type 1 glutamine amidotransferase-like domain-containing protein n=1 Tax=Dysgonomonas sp. ZJ709 TaxID=2709797 RepID=UPI0013EB5EE5|nr:peptidase E [Dysgonomonas sp. ZJ709]